MTLSIGGGKLTAQALPAAPRPKKDIEIATRIREFFDIDYYSVDQQRDMANEDLRFCDIDGAMWEGWLGDQFANRPRFEFNKVTQSVYRFIGEWVNNRQNVKFRPDDTLNGEDDASILNGLYRKDYRRSDGNQSVDNAVQEMAKTGVGAIKLSSEFVDEENLDDERQQITFDPIYNAYNSVIWDVNAKALDKSDANHVIVLHQFSKESFEFQFPDADLESFPPPNTRSRFNWRNTESNLFYVAEFYEIRFKKTEAVIYVHPQTHEKRIIPVDELKDEVKNLANLGFEKISTRRVKIKFVEKTVSSGTQILEKPTKINSKILPIIPLYGFRSFIDGEEFYFGLVRKMKDANRLFNMQISTLAENAATSSKRMPIVTPGMVAGLENHWAELHLGKYPYALLNPEEDENGQMVAAGPMGYLEPPIVDPSSAALIAITESFITSETGGNPQEVLNPEASGKAINAVAARVDMQTAVLMDNIKKFLKRTGQVYVSISKHIYDDTRTVVLLNEDDTEREVTLFESQMGEDGIFRTINDPVSGSFEVVVDTGPSYATKKRETVATLAEILQNTPAESPYFAFLYSAIIENVDGIGLDPLRDFNRRQMLIQGFRKPENEEEAKLLQQIQSQQNQPDPLTESQVKLLLAEAQKSAAEAQESQSKNVVNLATAREKLSKSFLNEAEAKQEGFNSQTKAREEQQRIALEQQKILLQAQQAQAAQQATAGGNNQA